jgi:opacity protein-like surface antigen
MELAPGIVMPTIRRIHHSLKLEEETTKNWNHMKKIILLTSIVCITNAANAYTEYYVSAKTGLGDATIYLDDMKFGDYLVKDLDKGSNYDGSGLLWGMSAAIGLDWSPNSMYVKQNPYSWFHLRLEGEFGYDNYNEDGKLKGTKTIDESDISNIESDINIKFNNFFMLANGYADFRIHNVVPYIGAGVGYSFGSIKANGDPYDEDGLIYAFHAGVAYKYSDITTFDLGYRRVYAPAEDNGLYVFGSVRLGARFRI